MSHVSLIYDYVDPDDINIIKGWLDSLDTRTKAKLNAKLNVLEQMNRTEWNLAGTEVLKGDKDGLIAVRVYHQRIQYRLLGYDGPDRGEFTLLAHCTEQGNKYRPLDIGRIAFDRRRVIEQDPTRNRRVRHDFR